MTDASNIAVGAVLQQCDNGGWCPISFFSKSPKDAETRYSTFDRELPTIYLAVKHFCYFLEGSQFYIWTDYMPLTFPLSSHSDQHSPRQICHLDLISLFTTDIRQGTHNSVEDALSSIVVNAIHCDGSNTVIDFRVIAEATTCSSRSLRWWFHHMWHVYWHPTAFCTRVFLTANYWQPQLAFISENLSYSMYVNQQICLATHQFQCSFLGTHMSSESKVEGAPSHHCSTLNFFDSRLPFWQGAYWPSRTSAPIFWQSLSPHLCWSVYTLAGSNPYSWLHCRNGRSSLLADLGCTLWHTFYCDHWQGSTVWITAVAWVLESSWHKAHPNHCVSSNRQWPCWTPSSTVEVFFESLSSPWSLGRSIATCTAWYTDLAQGRH